MFTSLVALHTPIEAVLEPMKLFECLGKGRFEIGSRFAVQALSLD
jgi:hypothetical protein